MINRHPLPGTRLMPSAFRKKPFNNMALHGHRFYRLEREDSRMNGFNSRRIARKLLILGVLIAAFAIVSSSDLSQKTSARISCCVCDPDRENCWTGCESMCDGNSECLSVCDSSCQTDWNVCMHSCAYCTGGGGGGSGCSPQYCLYAVASDGHFIWWLCTSCY